MVLYRNSNTDALLRRTDTDALLRACCCDGCCDVATLPGSYLVTISGSAVAEFNTSFVATETAPNVYEYSGTTGSGADVLFSFTAPTYKNTADPPQCEGRIDLDMYHSPDDPLFVHGTYYADTGSTDCSARTITITTGGITITCEPQA